MKNLAPYIIILVIAVVLVSCLKESLNKAARPSSLIGTTWSVVNDSTTTGFWGIWSGRATTGSNYIGKAGDYFIFITYGKLYSSINGQKDTETYKIGGDTVHFRYAYGVGQTNIIDSAWNTGYIISNLTNHTCTLSSNFITPETVLSGFVNLRK